MRLDEQCEVRIYYDNMQDRCSVAIIQKRADGSVSLAAPLTLEPIESGVFIEPTLIVAGNGLAQDVLNQLWQQGFRPKDGTGNGGHIDAVKYHLEDMRKMVFDLFGILKEKT